ncbi:MAG TPA: EAL domain-containing protein [Burkholderiales bacterium]|nr:EAL domain-containing protein [Burkholderiales bacterium]
MGTDPGQPFSGRLATAAAVLAAGILLSFAGWFYLLRLADAAPRDAAERQADRVAAALERELALHAEALRGVAGLVGAAPDLNPSQFERYVEHQALRQRFPAIEAWGLARLHPAASGSDPARSLLQVDHLVPLSSGALGPGDDLLADPHMRDAATRARRTGALAASARLAGAGQSRVLLLLPIYRSGDARQAAAGSDPAPLGVVFALLRPTELLAAVMAGEPLAAEDIALLDLGPAESPGSAGSLLDGPAPTAAGAAVLRRLEPGGRRWDLALTRVAPEPAPMALLAWALLAAGLGGTAFLAHRAGRRERMGEAAEILAAEGDVVWSRELPGGRLTAMSSSALNFYGHPRDEFLESPELWLSMVHPEDRTGVERLLRARESGQPATIECRILRADGVVRRILDRAWVTRNATGMPQQLDGVTTDITEATQVGDELHRLRRAMDQSPTALMLTGTDGRIEYVNARFCQLTGYSPEEALAATPRVLKSGLNEPAVYEELWRTLRSGETWSGEVFNRRKSGELYWEHNEIAPVRDAAGVITHFLAVKEDISGRRYAEQALGESERLFRSALNNIPDMFLIYGPDRRIRFVNDRVLAATGFTEQQMIGCRDEELFDPEHTSGYLPALRQAIESGAPASAECALLFRAGVRMDLAMSFMPVLSQRREVMQVLCVAHDVTRLQEHAASLNRVNRSLRMLSGCSQALVHAPDEEELLDSVCWTMLNLGGYDVVAVALARDDAARSVDIAMQAAREPVDPELLRFSWGLDPLGLGPAGTAIRTGRPAVSADLAADPHAAPWQAAAARHRLRACAALPLMNQGATIGAVIIYGSQGVRFDEREVDLLRELADDLSFGIITRRAAVARKRAEEQLRLRDRVIESSSNGILINDLTRPNNPIIYVNPAFERMTGYSAGEAIGRNPRFLIRTDRDQPGLERIRIALREKCEGRAALRSYHKDGTMFWVELSMSPVRNESGEATHFVTILNDITERQFYQEELEHQAYHDALTGLANRNLLPDRIRQAILHAHRSKQNVAVLLLDLDHFKLVNDSMGHAVGDSLLMAVAERLSAAVREGDTVARIGGDEFVVVIADAQREDHITLATQRIIDSVAEPVLIKGKELSLSASIGVSLYPRDGTDAETLLKNADVAMYRAKEQGRNNYQFYTPEMNARLAERVNMVSGLRHALSRNEFRLYYQPLVDVRHGDIVGLEVLTRWHHPQRGVVSPSVFIPVTEETGLIRPLGEWVLQNACEQGRAWRDMGLPEIVVAVNLSANQFRQKNLVAMVQQALRDTGMDPGQLELELTESVMMYNVDEVLGTLRDLKGLGVRISLDDFGTGYSSLSYLKRFPIDKLKIDRSFVRDVITNPEDAAIARAVIAMAHSLDMRVVAEGVETAAQLDFLRANHCDQFQGFFYAEALSAAESTELLRRTRLRPALLNQG